MGQVIFVVCRESVEALLIIGILYAWMSGREDERTGKRWILAGVVAGLGLATVLALTLVGVTHFLGGAARDHFEIFLLTFASALIVQMVMWMRTHGRTIKREMEGALERSARTASWWGAFFLVAIAVGREGSETVMFLYGSFIQLDSLTAYLGFFAAAGIGLALALVLFYLLQLGNRFVSWKWFFRITEILLLFLGSALLLSASEKLLNGPLAVVDLPGWIYATAWDTSPLLSDGSVFGNLLASLFAYRSQPIGWDLLVLGSYWVTVLLLFRWQGHLQERRAAMVQAAAEGN
ncbi:FTR1 family iron permease [Endothiovibrio diazotrophicus]